MHKIILHIGMPKTGTTSLQAFCTENTNKMRDIGILYPETGRSDDAHHELAWSVGKTGPDIDPMHLFRELKNEIDASGCKTVVISSEVFFVGTDVELLHSHLKKYKVEVVCYLRRQDVWFQAMYAQLIKHNRYRVSEPISNAKEMRLIEEHLDYYSVLKQWGQCFGHDSITIRSYENDKINKDVVTDFFDNMGIELDQQWDFQQNPGEINISLPIDYLKFVYMSNAVPFSGDTRTSWLYAMQNASGKYNQPKGSSNYQIIRHDLAVDICRQYSDGNSRLFEYAGSDSGVYPDFFVCEGSENSEEEKKAVFEDLSLSCDELARINVSLWAYYDEQINHYAALLELTQKYRSGEAEQ